MDNIIEYDIYHDESKEDHFWHAYLFVPTFSRELVLSKLKQVREGIDIKDFTTKNLKSDKAITYARYFLSILTAALQQKDNPKFEPFFYGNQYCKTNNGLVSMSDKFPLSPKFKVVILKKRGDHNDMNGFDDLKKIERTFVMGIKGANHYLFSPDESIIIKNIYLDGFEHYRIGHNRDFDEDFVKHHLISSAKSNIKYHHNFGILNGKTTSEDNIFLELIDIFLGAVRLQYLYSKGIELTQTQLKRLSIFSNIKKLFESRLNQGGARMRNSRFEKFGSFSSAFIENNEWKFEELNHMLFQQNKILQTSLF